MALSKFATPAEVREYRWRRRLAWFGTFSAIAVGALGVAIHFQYHAAASLPVVLCALVILGVTMRYAHNEQVAD